MKIRAIMLDEQPEPNPARVVVDMSIQEAAFIVKVAGNMVDANAEDIMPGGSKVYGEIYNSLAGNVFNRFWHDGINDAVKDIA